MIFHPIYKIILAGDGGAGKSTLLQSQKSGKYCPVDKLTIGVDFECHSIENNNKENPLTLLLFDLGGQKHFHFIHKAFIKGTKAGLILYDFSNLNTLYHLPHWVNLLNSEYPSLPIIIAGSKTDIASKERLEMFRAELEMVKTRFPKSVNIIDYIEFSTKNNENVDKIFEQLNSLATQWKSQRMAQMKKPTVLSKSN